jgi:two-component system nitrate/nitrite response regulator NarL
MAMTMRELSPAERMVLALVAQGKTNSEIARELGRSRSTVKHQVAAVLHKLGVRTRVEAAVELIRTGDRPRADGGDA